MKGIFLNGFSRPEIPAEEMAEFYRTEKRLIPKDRPYTWYMFVDTMDGRGTFLERGKAGGYHVALGHFKDDPERAKKYPDIVAGAAADWRLLQFG